MKFRAPIIEKITENMYHGGHVHNSIDGMLRSQNTRMRKMLGNRQLLRQEMVLLRHRMFSALANQVRIDLLISLRDGEKNVSTLMKELGQGQTLVSHNLRKLVTAGFINVRKDGNFRYYSLNKKLSEPLFMLIAAMDGHNGHTKRKK